MSGIYDGWVDEDVTRTDAESRARVRRVETHIFSRSCRSDLHHLRGSPSDSLGSRNETLGPARIFGIELLNGCCTLNKHTRAQKSRLKKARQLFNI